jgi:hypothetical protein
MVSVRIVCGNITRSTNRRSERQQEKVGDIKIVKQTKIVWCLLFLRP